MVWTVEGSMKLHQFEFFRTGVGERQRGYRLPNSNPHVVESTTPGGINLSGLYLARDEAVELHALLGHWLEHGELPDPGPDPLPCPCGEAPDVIDVGTEERWVVRCVRCDARPYMRASGSRGEVIAAWNLAWGER